MEFGPVFNREFLIAVHDLQQQILRARIYLKNFKIMFCTYYLRD